MNNRGFTLIELIAIISLLLIIVVIAFVSINEVVRQSKVSDCENIVKNIISASKEYVSDNRYNFTTGTTFLIDAGILLEDYLSGPVINPFTNEEIVAGDIVINIELDEDYTVKNITIGAPEILKECKNE